MAPLPPRRGREIPPPAPAIWTVTLDTSRRRRDDDGPRIRVVNVVVKSDTVTYEAAVHRGDVEILASTSHAPSDAELARDLRDVHRELVNVSMLLHWALGQRTTANALASRSVFAEWRWRRAAKHMRLRWQLAFGDEGAAGEYVPRWVPFLDALNRGHEVVHTIDVNHVTFWRDRERAEYHGDFSPALEVALLTDAAAMIDAAAVHIHRHLI